MKKFFSNLWVMVASLALAVILLVACIWLCARPISYNMAYTHTEDGATATYTFSGSKIVMEVTEDGETDKLEGVYYLKDGRFIPNLGAEMTSEEFKAFCEELSAEEWESYSEPINAFSAGSGDFVANCSGAVVLVIVLGIVELAVIAGATLSTILYIKSRKETPAA